MENEVADAPTDSHHGIDSGSWRRAPRTLVWGSVAVLAVAMLTSVVLYTTYLASSVTAGAPRLRVTRGEVVRLPVSGARETVKVHLCRFQGTRQRCTALDSRASGKLVGARIPLDYPLGNAILKVVGARQQVLFIQRVVVVPPRLRPLPTSPATPPNPYGPTPTPPGPYGPTATPTETPRPTSTPPGPY